MGDNQSMLCSCNWYKNVSDVTLLPGHLHVQLTTHLEEWQSLMLKPP